MWFNGSTNAIFIESEIYSEAELEKLSDSVQRYELIRGELQAMAPVGGVHGNLTSNISALVGLHIFDDKLGKTFAAETGFIVEENPRTILAPDFAFIVRERVPIPIPDNFVPVVPELVLETRSPGDTARAVAAKVELWLEVGAREVWELNPRRQILTVYTPDADPLALGANDNLESELLPGLSLELRLVLN